MQDKKDPRISLSTGGYDENWRTTSNVWQLDAGNNFAKTEGQE